ncbi:MAG: hypothetical protein WA916_08970 [Arcobacter sp.]|uniref:hypothetical protein n=1 Tax=Arcobacter sp. TaxID=1872629 RepID=UPI003C7344DA
MITSGDRYIGGGKIFFTPKDGEEVEIGEIQEATISTSVEFAEAWSKDTSMAKLVERIAKKVDASGKFSTQKVNLTNTAMFLLGTEATEDFVTGDTLPDGTTATADVTIAKIIAGNKPVVEGELKFIGDEDGAKKPVIVIPSVVLTPSGDLPMIVDEFAKLSFDFAILQTGGKLFDEYLMDVGA